MSDLVGDVLLVGAGGEQGRDVTASYGAASARGATADANALLNEAKRHRPDDGPEGAFANRVVPSPTVGAGGAALRPPDASPAPDDPNPPDVR